jgi:hypothetical protein
MCNSAMSLRSVAYHVVFGNPKSSLDRSKVDPGSPLRGWSAQPPTPNLILVILKVKPGYGARRLDCGGGGEGIHCVMFIYKCCASCPLKRGHFGSQCFGNVTSRFPTLHPSSDCFWLRHLQQPRNALVVPSTNKSP